MGNKWIAREIDGEFRLIPAEEYEPSVRTQILTDTIEPTWHPATGEHCSSRTGMVKIAKAHGLEEIGNDHIPKKEYQPDRQKIRERLIAEYDRLNR